jgi:hypothetical protein
MKKVPEKVDSGLPAARKGPRRTSVAAREKIPCRGDNATIRAIQHRVINQLNLISNILYFQGRFNREDRCASLLAANQRRIKAMAMVYEHIGRAGDFNRVQFSGYCKSLLAEIAGSAQYSGKKVVLKTRIAAVSVDVSTAITCGLIINEMLDNALKHAFPGNGRGEIRFSLQKRPDGALAMVISDNGAGLPPEVQWQRGDTMGSFLINTLSENLKGELTVDVNDGTSFRLSFHPPAGTVRRGR